MKQNDKLKKIRAGKKKPGPTNDHATPEYLFMKKNLIFKWIANGITMTEVAHKLKVSRSWMLDMFNIYEDLDKMRKEALIERKERIHATLYSMAVGNYTTESTHTTKVTRTDGEGNSSVDTIVEEDRHEHRNDPSLRALSIYMRTENLKNQNPDASKILDSFEPSSFEYVDVAEEAESSDEESGEAE